MVVTMRDVAQKVGVSKQTVSAVLNGKPGISAATVAKVRAAIAELGYQPNLVATSLRRGFNNTIGLLLGDVTNPYFSQLARGAEDVAIARGYGVMLCNTYDDPARWLMYLQMFVRQQIPGVVGVSEDKARELGLPASCIFQEAPLMDDRRGGYVATAHLLDLGHRRIACITAPATSLPGIERMRGFQTALSDWNVEFDSRLVVEASFDYASGTQAVKQLLQVNHDNPPTAIFVHQDLIAIGAITALKRAGLRVPEDVAMIGYDGLEIASLYDPALSTIIQPVYQMGVHAMAQLLDKLEGKAASELDPLDCTLVVRQSTVADLMQEHCSQPIATGEPWRDWRIETQ
ncbi:LacI family DNA-binding transcriptional regulator [Dictyobacter aurantiacus]|uniref:LacI family transcriptional regulator n=1 Tax=Dictyobacter aurantiacus TaxID=1936993 RepID=A0A401ZSX8_9CHLR|nr:LacI family DNA-binding transcriptional regulator [Dictyobacter aurantiacus]GCE09973.1 LacI family transcriptional regulator [Dictyobacter aurantiacus]